jgi:hypothetical protein
MILPKTKTKTSTQRTPIGDHTSKKEGGHDHLQFHFILRVDASIHSNFIIMPKHTSKEKNQSIRRRGKKREVIFDPEARKEHLRGFSERKRQRRAYGLAMQRVKDRTAKIDQRAEEKKDQLERVVQAEEQKALLLEEAMLSAGTIKESKNDEESDEEENKNNEDDLVVDAANEKDTKKTDSSKKVIQTKTYDDEKTESHWGGQVTVTTSVVHMGDDGSSDDEVDIKSKKSVDAAQRYAGDVQKYMNAMKGSMPGKKKKEHQPAKRKGKNGAADMKGMGGSATLKLAQKVLAKSKAINPKHQTPQKKGKKTKTRR